MDNDHLQIGLPFKAVPKSNYDNPQLHSRLKSLNRKLIKDPDLKTDYVEFMESMVSSDFIEEVPTDELSEEKCYYLSHHGVRHKRKKTLRIVFDCSMKTSGRSLNDYLLTGPNMANSLVGVLLRFRIERIAVVGDIAKMFNMIRLAEEDRDFYRFLWYREHDINSDPVSYRMKVHLFGSTCSPAIANYALKRSVECEQDQRTKSVVLDSFYVDDMMHSFAEEDLATEVVHQVQDVLRKSGFKLTKFVSNSRRVLRSLPSEDLAGTIEAISFKSDLPQQQTLGIQWHPEDDLLGYNVDLPEQPYTKRGVLSTIAAIFDPLGIASPALVRGKRIFQICCDMKLGWDSPLPEKYVRLWNKYKAEIPQLNSMKIPRCYKNSEANSTNTQLHILADGSTVAYGAVAYIRHEYSDGDVSSSIVMAKARLTPINRSSLKTVPRIELNAAKLAVDLFVTIREELQKGLNIHGVRFWTDSIAVLQYLKSERGQFQSFVANRVAHIRSITSLSEWCHVPGELNPADLLSRGTSDVSSFTTDTLWKEGPPFLKDADSSCPQQLIVADVDDSDPEMKKRQYNLATKEVSLSDPISVLLNSTSSLFKLKCRLATFRRLQQLLLGKPFNRGAFDIHELDAGEIEIFKLVQWSHFGNLVLLLQRGEEIPMKHYLKGYNLFIDKKGLIRVGGRLERAPIPYDARHPILLDGRAFPVKLLVIGCHRDLGHLGKETVLAKLKERFHIVAVSKLLERILRSCVLCKRVQGKVMDPIMADLPEKRLCVSGAPFSHTATDLFGPFHILWKNS